MNNQFIAQMMQVLKSGNNPEQFLMSVMNKNPQAMAMFQQAKNSGNMEQFVRGFAKQNNIDIQPLIDMFGGK